MENKISLSLNLVNAVMAYLGKQPYEQVFQMINAINDEAKGQVSAAPAPAPEEPAE